MYTISRARRAEMQRRARYIRQQGQLAEWSAARTVAAILADLPDMGALEAWRLAHGWSRQHVVAAVGGLYARDGLAAPSINSSMLCRWEHGETTPGHEYALALSRLYQVRPDQLGLPTHRLTAVRSAVDQETPRYARSIRAPDSVDDNYEGEKGDEAALAAVRESVLFAVEVEGPAGGPATRDQLDQAIQYFALKYSALPIGRLTAEVHRCRGVVVELMAHSQSTTARTELRRLGGWLSALLGNLALHLGDYEAARIHLDIAAALAADIGHNRLMAWTLGAQSMLARYQDRYVEALAC